MKKRFGIFFILIYTGTMFAQVANKSTTSKKDFVIYLSDQTFKQKVFDYSKNKDWKYEGSIPCIVDFYADWCGPCRRVSPILEEIAKEYSGKLIVYKVNTDKEQVLSGSLGIQSLPTILFVPKTGNPQVIMGAYPKEDLIKLANSIIK
jgi:thioredoxin 1